MNHDEKPPETNEISVARLLQEIDLQYQAAYYALSGNAVGVAKHEFITARTERLEVIREQLAGLVGSDEATKLVIEQMNKASDKAREV